jgi:hypothetical protein
MPDRIEIVQSTTNTSASCAHIILEYAAEEIDFDHARLAWRANKIRVKPSCVHVKTYDVSCTRSDIVTSVMERSCMNVPRILRTIIEYDDSIVCTDRLACRECKVSTIQTRVHRVNQQLIDQTFTTTVHKHTPKLATTEMSYRCAYICSPGIKNTQCPRVTYRGGKYCRRHGKESLSTTY